MKKVFTIMVVMAVALGVTKAQAQDSDYKKFSLGLGLEGALPTGGLKSLYNVGAGATVRAAIGLDKASAVTLTTGVVAFIPKDLGSGIDVKAQINIPIKAGYRYMLSDSFYGIGEAGVSIIKSYYNNGSSTLQSVSSSEFTYAPGIGVLLGGFDASLRYEGYSSAGFLGLRVGFTF
jgi:hypothetical protein